MKYENGLETKQIILDVSKELFFKNGFHKTSIRKIAAKAHLSSGALYKHFENKEAILDAIISPYTEDCWNTCQQMFDEFQKNISQTKTVEDIKKQLQSEDVDFLYRYIHKNADVWRFVFFKSAGTKYESFFDDFLTWESDITLDVLQEIDPDKKYRSVVSDMEIRFIIKGFYNMLLRAFSEEFDEAARVNYFHVIGEIYSDFWEKIFLIGVEES